MAGCQHLLFGKLASTNVFKVCAKGCAPIKQRVCAKGYARRLCAEINIIVLSCALPPVSRGVAGESGDIKNGFLDSEIGMRRTMCAEESIEAHTQMRISKSFFCWYAPGYAPGMR